MKVDAPPGFDVERIVVTYVKQQSEPTPPSPKPKPKPKPKKRGNTLAGIRMPGPANKPEQV